MFDYIKGKTNKFIKQGPKAQKALEAKNDTNGQIKHATKIHSLNAILHAIDTGVLSKDILTSIAPAFQFTPLIKSD